MSRASARAAPVTNDDVAVRLVRRRANMCTALTAHVCVCVCVCVCVLRRAYDGMPFFKPMEIFSQVGGAFRAVGVDDR